MSERAASNEREQSTELNVDSIIAACGGSERVAIRALIIANEYFEC